MFKSIEIPEGVGDDNKQLTYEDIKGWTYFEEKCSILAMVYQVDLVTVFWWGSYYDFTCLIGSVCCVLNGVCS